MITFMMLSAESQRARALTAVGAGLNGAGLNGHAAVAGSAGAGFVVRTSPWMTPDASRKSALTQTPFGTSLSFSHIAQPSTAAASGLCASKQYQEKARSAAAIGGALGSLPPRDPV